MTLASIPNEAAARALGVRIQALKVGGPDDLESAFRAAVEGGAEALIVVGVNFFIPHRQRIVNLEIKNRLPKMHTHGLRAVPPRRPVHGQDLKGRQARRSSRGTAQEVQPGHQPENCQATRHNYPAEHPLSGDQGD